MNQNDPRKAWFHAAEIGLAALLPHKHISLADGNEFVDGYSISSADRAYRDGWPVQRYINAVAEKRKLIRKYA